MGKLYVTFAGECALEWEQGMRLDVLRAAYLSPGVNLYRRKEQGMLEALGVLVVDELIEEGLLEERE